MNQETYNEVEERSSASLNEIYAHRETPTNAGKHDKPSLVREMGLEKPG